MRRAIFIFCLALFTLGPSTLAQTGFPAFGSFQRGSFDGVNRQNLNVNFAIPIMSTSARGQTFQYSLVNDSLLWTQTTVGSTTSWTSVVDASGNPTWGWTYGSAVSGSGQNLFQGQGSSHQCRYIDPNTGLQAFASWSTTTYSHFAYRDWLGSVHPFSGSYVVTSASQAAQTYCGITNSTTGPVSGYSTDNTGFYFSANNGSMSVVSPAGVNSGGAPVDTNGNYVSQTVVNSTETDWTDTAGHLALKVFTNTSNPNIQYEWQDSSGAYTPTTTVKRSTLNIKTNFGCTGVNEFTGTANLPYEIDLPNGQKYLITYESTPGNSGYYTGRVKRVTLPTAGYYEYDYPTTAGDGIVCADSSVNSLTRLANDGTNTYTWTYSRSPSGSNWITTVTAPQMPYDSAANVSKFTFNSIAQETIEQYYQGSTTLLRTINSAWASNGSLASQTTILEDNNTQTEVEYSYDNYGNLLSQKQHDWGSGAPGSVLRTTTYAYLTSTPYTNLNILNRLTTKTIADSTGTIRYRQVIAYDGTTLGPCPTGAAQHNDANYGCSNTTRGNVTSVTTYADPVTPAGGVTKNSYYDVFGNLVQADLDCCQSKKWTYSATTQYAFPDSDTCGATGGPQLTTSYTYNGYTGQLVTTTDPNNLVTTNAYDNMKRPTSITRPDNSQIIYTYNDSAYTSAISNPVDATHSRIQTTAYNGLNQPVQTMLSDAASNVYSITQTQYDPVGRPYKVSNPFTGTAQYWTTTQVDALARKTKRILQDNSQTSYSYSTNTLTATDPTGKQRKLQFDPMQHLVSLFEPDVTNNNSLTVQTSYTYTVLDKLATVTQGVQSRTYSYDGIGQLTSETTPEAGTVSYQYNNYGLVTQRTDARGVITTNSIDTLNRRTQVSYNVGTTGVPATSTLTYTYGTSAAQFNNGKLITLTDGVGSEAYSYDNLGRTTQLQKIISGTTYTTSYQYNLGSGVTSLTYPSGRVVQPAYDAIGRLASTSSGTTTYASGISYSANSQVTGFSYGNGIAANETYSADRLQLQNLTYTKGSLTISGLAYGYSQNGGNNGEITSITDSVDSGRTVNYTYDALHRLSSAVTNGSTNYAKWGLTWAYDRYGNRLNQTATYDGPPTNSLSFANPGGAQTNRPDGMCFDANGDITAESGTCPPSAPTFAYDAENRLVSYMGSGGTYTYDGNGLRVKKATTSTTTVYIYSGGHPIAEYDNGASPSSPSREYILSGDQPLAKIESGATNYYHADHLSVRLITDSSGNTLGQQGHYPFGESWYSSGTTTKWAFTSYERDAESGNDYALARYYLNGLGRFASADPVETMSGKKAQALNRYSYVTNDPAKLTDPSGKFIVYASGTPPDASVDLGCVADTPSSMHFDVAFSICSVGGGGGGGGDQVGQETCTCINFWPPIPFNFQGAGCGYECDCPSSPLVIAIDAPRRSLKCFLAPCPVITAYTRVFKVGNIGFGYFHDGVPPWCE